MSRAPIFPDPNAHPSPVYLARLPETFENTHWDPQRVRVLDNSNGVIILNNKDRIAGDPFNFIVQAGAMVQNVNRIAVLDVLWGEPVTNCNKINNVFNFLFAAGPPITITVPPGAYTNGTDAATAFTTAAATAGWPALTMSYSNLTGKFTIQYLPQAFILDPTCSAATYGVNMWAFISAPVYSNTLVSEIALLTFSQYYVVNCNDVTKYDKNISSVSDGHSSDTLYVMRTTPFTSLPFSINQSSVSTQTWKAFEPQTQVYTFNFNIRDQWGMDPMLYTDSPNTWYFAIALRTAT
jgi:hypothetical protein